MPKYENSLGETLNKIFSLLRHKVSSSTIKGIVSLTQTEYDTITPDESTLYIIIPEPS